MGRQIQGGSVIRVQLLDRRGAEVDELLTMKEASTVLDLSRSRIAQLIGDGELKKFPIDDRTYFLSRREVEQYAQSPHKPGPKKRSA